MFLVNEGKVAQAVNTLRFECVPIYFRKIGEAPNITDETCLDWIVATSARPLVNFLRAETVEANEAKAFISSFLGAGREHLAIQPKLQAMLSQFEAIHTLFEVVAHTPSSDPRRRPWCARAWSPSRAWVRRHWAWRFSMGRWQRCYG